MKSNVDRQTFIIFLNESVFMKIIKIVFELKYSINEK